MRNSLVFHDTDKITTLMMHASPAMTAWTLRWYPDPNQVQRLTPDTQAAMQHASWAEMTVMPTIFYMVWVLAYYLLTFVLLRNRIEGRGRLTMFSLMVPQDPEKAKRSPLARVVLSAGKAWQPFIYLGCHAVAATIALLPTKLFFDHYWLHTAALLAMLGLAIWNGASYYFIVFAKKYMARLEEQTGVRVNGDTKKVT